MKSNKGIPFPVPDYLYIATGFLNPIVSVKSLNDLYQYANHIAYEDICISLCLHCVRFLCTKIHSRDKKAQEAILSQFLSDYKSDYDEISSYINWMDRLFELENIGPRKAILIKKCKKFIQFVSCNREALQEYCLYHSLSRWKIKVDDTPPELVVMLLHWYQYIDGDFLKFSWGLSSGENNLLNMFSKFYSLVMGSSWTQYIGTDNYQNYVDKIFADERGRKRISNHKKECDSMIIFMDEADLSYHPEWQRNFMLILTEFLDCLLEKTVCHSVQLIFSTHSPLMLGDLPEQSVAYLHKDSISGHFRIERGLQKTFGQNLYSILKEGFYLENGAIGALASRQMNEILQYTATVCTNIRQKNEGTNKKAILSKLDEYENCVLSHIGDGFLRNALQREIDEARKIIAEADNSRDEYLTRRQLIDENERLKQQIAELQLKQN